jgi:hypothetical protein
MIRIRTASRCGSGDSGLELSDPNESERNAMIFTPIFGVKIPKI